MVSAKPKIGIIIVAYNAASTLTNVLDRIAPDFRKRVTKVLICDDHSSDATYDVGRSYDEKAADLPITVIRNPRNLGYGGNQRSAYRLASKMGLDIVVLLHGDGQYAPEMLPDIVAPLEEGRCDAVMGSRMMTRGGALSGGMPLYKFVGNRILTKLENAMLNSSLSEFHSGYRAYRTDVLDSLPLEQNDDGFAFDTQIIIQLLDAGKRIVEVPIPTYYGDEICYVNGMRYALDVSGEAIRYRLAMMGFGPGPKCLPADRFLRQPYEVKSSENSSHAKLLTIFADLPTGKVLDLGCSSGLLSERVRKIGHTVVGLDVEAHEGIDSRVDKFVQADLDDGLPHEIGDDFDVILCADVLEHLRNPRALLREVRSRMKPTGVLIACVPNFGHWYPRLRTTFGLFDYDQRGILDQGHVRFFTRRSIERILSSEGYQIRHRTATGLPIELLARSGGRHMWSLLGKADRALSALRPQLFGYQLIYELVAASPDDAVVANTGPTTLD